MAKNPTPWSNNDIKPPANWSKATKGVAAWANNVTKNRTAFVQSTKGNAAWAKTTVTAVPYLYDDPTRLWDDTPLLGYDYKIPVTNTINDKVPSAWSPS